MNNKIIKRRQLKQLKACSQRENFDVAYESAQRLLLECIDDDVLEWVGNNSKGLLLYEQNPGSLAALTETKLLWDQIPFPAGIGNQVKIAGAMPTAEYALLLSNLAFDWLDAGLFIRQLDDLLVPDGVFWFTAFGAGTALNSRTILAELDNYAHFNDFYEMQDIGDALLGAGFKDVSLSSSTYQLEYTQLEVALADAYRLFGVNKHEKRRRVLGGKSVYTAFKSRVENSIREQGVFVEQFELILAHGRKASRSSFGQDIPVRMGAT